MGTTLVVEIVVLFVASIAFALDRWNFHVLSASVANAIVALWALACLAFMVLAYCPKVVQRRLGVVFDFAGMFLNLAIAVPLTGVALAVPLSWLLPLVSRL